MQQQRVLLQQLCWKTVREVSSAASLYSATCSSSSTASFHGLLLDSPAMHHDTAQPHVLLMLSGPEAEGWMFVHAAISPIAESPDQSERDTSATPEAVNVTVDCRASEAAQAATHAPQQSSTGALHGRKQLYTFP